MNKDLNKDFSGGELEPGGDAELFQQLKEVDENFATNFQMLTSSGEKYDDLMRLLRGIGNPEKGAQTINLLAEEIMEGVRENTEAAATETALRVAEEAERTPDEWVDFYRNETGAQVAVATEEAEIGGDIGSIRERIQRIKNGEGDPRELESLGQQLQAIGEKINNGRDLDSVLRGMENPEPEKAVFTWKRGLDALKFHIVSNKNKVIDDKLKRRIITIINKLSQFLEVNKDEYLTSFMFLRPMNGKDHIKNWFNEDWWSEDIKKAFKNAIKDFVKQK